MSSQKYLSKDGLSHLWSQITTQFVKKEAGKDLFSGNYSDLTGAPTNVSSFTNDAGYAVASEVADTYVTKSDYDTKVKALEQADTDNLTTAKGYADTQDATTLSSAKSYADTQDGTTLSSAKSYADTGDSTTLASAKSYTDEAVGAITGFDFQIVDALPATGSKGVIYLVPAAEGDDATTDSNIYSEYLWITTGSGDDATGSFELIGSTQMDLTGYLKEVDIEAVTNDEIDSICAAADSASA
jgi:hypothetical protein